MRSSLLIASAFIVSLSALTWSSTQDDMSRQDQKKMDDWFNLSHAGNTPSQQSQTSQSSANSSSRLTNRDVIGMVSVGLSDAVIIEKIKTTKSPDFDTSVEGLRTLKKNRVSDAVVRAVIDASANVPQRQQHEPSPTGFSARVAPTAATSSPNLPTEIGVYLSRNSLWVDVLPEIVNWKTGGVIKSVASVGFVRGDVNGHVNGGGSALRLSQPVELLIVAPEGTAMTEYQLLHLHPKEHYREFRTITGGVMHVSSGATRDLVDFQWTKLAPRTFSVRLSNLPSGEYGLLPPGAIVARNAAGSQGKLYTFHIVE